MATNTKRDNPDHVENSELEVMRAKIKKLEAKVEELQRINNGQVDHHEDQKNDVMDFLLVFMNNNGFKQIAYKILSSLDCKSFFLCRSVCRSWRDFIDNEWSMLQMQLFHLNEEIQYKMDFDPLIKIMKENPDKSELRVFIKMFQELVSKRCNFKLECNPEKYMIDHHRHQELEILIDYPIQKNLNPENGKKIRAKISDHFTTKFKYACQFGCNICVKLFLDRSEGMEIDFNSVKTKEICHRDSYQFDHCLHVAYDSNDFYGKEVLDLLLRNAEEKGIDINHKGYLGKTLRDAIIQKFHNWGDVWEIEEIDFTFNYTDFTYKILKIDPNSLKSE